MTSAEVQATMEWNPIARAAAKLEYSLAEGGITRGHRWEYLHRPEPPDLPDTDPFDPAYLNTVLARAVAMQKAVRVGCRVVVETVFGEVVATAWVRNIDYAGVFPLSLSKDIAMLLACIKTREIAQQQAQNQVSSG